MFIYLQKCHRIFGNISFWFNGRCIDDVEALFSTSVITSLKNIKTKIIPTLQDKRALGSFWDRFLSTCGSLLQFLLAYLLIRIICYWKR